MSVEALDRLEQWQGAMRGYLAAPTLGALEEWSAAMADYLAAVAPGPVTGAMPNHRLSVHWICDQVRQSDKEYMAALRPAVIKMVNPSPDRVREAFSYIDPAGHVALRYHPISEQHAESQADPVGTAKKHAQYWIDQLNGNYKAFDRSKLYVMGLNEPPVHNDAEEKRQALYTETLLRVLQPHGIPAYVFNFSVGWPREVAGRIVWDNFLYLEPLINETKSFGCVHEYGYPHLVQSGWGSYGNRISRCPMKIKFVIGECGYTRQLAGLPQPWGWDGNISADAYAAMLWEYADKVDPGKVFAVMPFTTSFGGEEWRNKDTAKAHGAILARKHNYAWPNPWPSYAVVPPVEPPPEEEDDVRTIILPNFAGKITGFYGQAYPYPHEGMDISMTSGTPLYAPYDGVIAWSDFDIVYYGNYVRVYCPALRANFFYAHLSDRRVQTGNSVKAGQVIGLSGNTGNSTGPHLHFEVRQVDANGSYVIHKAGQPLYRRNGRVDPLGWLTGWISAGGKVEYR